MVNEIVSLIFFSWYFVISVYMQDFHVLILCPATWPHSVMSSSSFLVAYLGFSTYSIVSSVKGDSFTSSFPIWIPLLSFSSLIAVVRTSKTVLNKNGKNRPPCLVPDLRGNAFCFSPLNMMLALALSLMRVCHVRSFEWVCPMCPVEICSLCAHFPKSFLKITNGCWILSKPFSHLLRWSCGFYSSVCWYGVSYQLICGYWRILASLG